MDVLVDKSNTLAKEYLSRYANFPFYYHSLDEKHMQGLSAQLNPDTAFVYVNITEDSTLESLSNKYYGRPDYWWIIADFNRIQDPFISLHLSFNRIKIPSMNSIEFVEEVSR